MGSRYALGKLCADCVIAHQRLIITRFHALSDFQ